MRIDVRVQQRDFDVAEELDKLSADDHSIGAIANFVGKVRSRNEGEVVSDMELEHYPGMTEKSICRIVDSAVERWQLQAATVIHRVGHLKPGDQIVWVGVAAAHRGNAFSACEFIMDYLKTQAPFWKKEKTPQGDRWVDARESDDRAAERW